MITAHLMQRDERPLEEGVYTCPDDSVFYWTSVDVPCPYCKRSMSECHATNFAIVRRMKQHGIAVIDQLPAGSRVFGCTRCEQRFSVVPQ